MVFEMFFPQNTFKNHFVGSLGLGASTFWLPQPNPPNSKGDLNAVFRSGWQGKDKGRWQSAGKGLKLHGRVWGPGGTRFAQALKASLNAEFRPGKAMAKGERCTGGFPVLVKRASYRGGNRLNAIFDLAKRWQRAKAAQRVLGPWGERASRRF